MHATQFDLMLRKFFGNGVHTYGVYHVGGGSINQAYKLITSKGIYFVKVNSQHGFEKVFECEVKGLREIELSKSFKVPKPIGFGSIGELNYLLLEWVEQGPLTDIFWDEFGKQLAELHLKTHKYYGYPEDNFIGSLVQSNSRTSNWSDFFMNQRLRPLVREGVNKGLIDKPHLIKFERYFRLAESIFPEEQPALLHGDLWSGNIMTNENSEPVLIDPAVYFGHREMDIAMTFFVGQFPERFYQSYNERFPLQPEWRYRIEFGLMYYQLVHLHLFGGSYLHKIYSNLDRWT